MNHDSMTCRPLLMHLTPILILSACCSAAAASPTTVVTLHPPPSFVSNFPNGLRHRHRPRHRLILRRGRHPRPPTPSSSSLLLNSERRDHRDEEGEGIGHGGGSDDVAAELDIRHTPLPWPFAPHQWCPQRPINTTAAIKGGGKVTYSGENFNFDSAD